jgi:hypothetical protein
LKRFRAQVRWPIVIFWYAAQTHRAARHHRRSLELLGEAYRVFRERAAQMPDDATRASFEAVCYHRDLVAAHDRKAWPELRPMRRHDHVHSSLGASRVDGEPSS